MSPIPSPISLPQLVYKGIPVITTDTLAQAYEVETHQIRQNFKNNKERFVEGKHLFSLSGNDLREFKHGVENFYSVPKNVNALVLWTERGAARHAKMLNSDKAWDVFEFLEETFFRVTQKEPVENPDQLPIIRESAESRNKPLAKSDEIDKFRNLSISDFAAPSPDAPLTPDQQCTLQAIVRAKVEALPREQRGGMYPKTWSRFNNHFRLAKYCQLPQSRLSEAVIYLTQLDVTEGRQALPTATPALSPAPAFRTDFPADMHTGRKDALRKIQSLMAGVGAARDVVRLFCHPGGKSMRMTLDEREIYDALYQLYCAADDSLLAAYRALDAGYKIGRQYGRG